MISPLFMVWITQPNTYHKSEEVKRKAKENKPVSGKIHNYDSACVISMFYGIDL